MNNKILVSFALNCGRMGDLDGLFITTHDAIIAAIGKTAYFGEVLGKHSDVEWEIDGSCLTEKSADQELIAKLEAMFGRPTLCGFNPLEYVNDEDEEPAHD